MMPETVFCCDIPYDGRGSCVICGKPLSKARARQKQKEKSQKSIVEKMAQDAEFKRRLFWKSIKFAWEEFKKSNPYHWVECPCCHQQKQIYTFTWIHGEKPQYDILSDQFNQQLFNAYGRFIHNKQPICGNCVKNYSLNNLPRDGIAEEQSRLDSKKKWWRKNNSRLTPPENGICPKCLRERSLHPNAWCRDRENPDIIICRRCRQAENAARKSLEE